LRLNGIKIYSIESIPSECSNHEPSRFNQRVIGQRARKIKNFDLSISEALIQDHH